MSFRNILRRLAVEADTLLGEKHGASRGEELATREASRFAEG